MCVCVAGCDQSVHGWSVNEWHVLCVHHLCINSSVLGALLTPRMVRLCNLQLCVYLCKYMMCLAER